jgi:hypothetical protein
MEDQPSLPTSSGQQAGFGQSIVDREEHVRLDLAQVPGGDERVREGERIGLNDKGLSDQDRRFRMHPTGDSSHEPPLRARAPLMRV